MLKIRLARVGKKKQPTYRVIVADARAKRDGRNLVEHMIDRVRAGDVDPIDAERIIGPLIPPVRGERS